MWAKLTLPVDTVTTLSHNHSIPGNVTHNSWGVNFFGQPANADCRLFAESSPRAQRPMVMRLSSCHDYFRGNYCINSNPKLKVLKEFWTSIAVSSAVVDVNDHSGGPGSILAADYLIVFCHIFPASSRGLSEYVTAAIPILPFPARWASSVGRLNHRALAPTNVCGNFFLCKRKYKTIFTYLPPTRPQPLLKKLYPLKLQSLLWPQFHSLKPNLTDRALKVQLTWRNWGKASLNLP